MMTITERIARFEPALGLDPNGEIDGETYMERFDTL